MKISHVFINLIYLLHLFTPLYSYEYNNISKVFVIADVHGDIKRFQYILQEGKIIDQFGSWIAEPNTVVIQLGDQIDPKKEDNNIIDINHHFDMIYYTDILEKKAIDHNCSFISLIGNHEHMNIDKIRKKKALADIIANRPIVVKVNDNIFCHASVKQHHLDVLRMNGKSWDNINMLWHKFVKNSSITEDERNIIQKLILDEDSIIYTKIPDNKLDVIRVLNYFDAQYMFVGHLISKHIHVNNRIWYLDQLLSVAFAHKSYTYITIYDDDIKINTLKYGGEESLLLIF